MKDKIFGVLQRVGRSFMLPIALLPVAGLLLGIGSSFTNPTTLETYGLTEIIREGVMYMEDGGMGDEKIIAIPYGDPTYMAYTDVKELSKHIFEELKHFSPFINSWKARKQM